LRFQRFDARDGLAALGIERDKAIEVDGRAAILKGLTIFIRALAQILTRKHGAAF